MMAILKKFIENVAGKQILVLVNTGLISTVVRAELHSTNEPHNEELCLPHIYACVFPLHTLHSCRAFLGQKKSIKSLET